eukprot:g55968.t1
MRVTSDINIRFGIIVRSLLMIQACVVEKHRPKVILFLSTILGGCKHYSAKEILTLSHCNNTPPATHGWARSRIGDQMPRRLRYGVEKASGMRRAFNKTWFKLFATESCGSTVTVLSWILVYITVTNAATIIS